VPAAERHGAVTHLQAALHVFQTCAVLGTLLGYYN
jgi:hypothetical protein